MSDDELPHAGLSVGVTSAGEKTAYSSRNAYRKTGGHRDMFCAAADAACLWIIHEVPKYVPPYITGVIDRGFYESFLGAAPFMIAVAATAVLIWDALSNEHFGSIGKYDPLKIFRRKREKWDESTMQMKVESFAFDLYRFDEALMRS
jgi:hypothetical protein